jgi:glutamate/tyrosine decarboxylase-like PLP-dependent enzyme
MVRTVPCIPESGRHHDEIRQDLDRLSGQDVDWKGHRVFSLVYKHSEAHDNFMKEVHARFLSTNGLNPMAFQSLKRMEADVVAMTAAMLHGGPETVGTLTSGGTESILAAVLAYREHARKHRPWVLRPEILVPASAHAAFYKAGHLFGVRIVRVPLETDFRANVAATRRRVGFNTIALVGSAPCYPYGVVDPIADLAALAHKKGLGMHVDACLGGYLLPFVESLKPEERLADVPTWDFRIPGVTSISADVHKYGYAAKGASTIVYRSMDWLKHQFTVETDWCGGIYASPTLAGTRPGGPIAAAWAALQALGRDGYATNAKALMAVARSFVEGVNAIPGLAILGDPCTPVLAIGSQPGGPNINAVGDLVEKCGWNVDRLQNPAGLHLILNAGHADVSGRFLEDLRAAALEVQAHPELAAEGSAPLYGMIAKIPLRGVVKKNVLALLEQMYSPGAAGTDAAPTAGVDLDGAVPPIVRDALRAWHKLRSRW